MSAVAGGDLIFRQLFENRSFTYTYILADAKTRDAVIIDPVLDVVERDVQIITDLGLNVKYGLNTHVHADHVTGTGEMKKLIPSMQSVLGEPRAMADIYVKEGDKIYFGNFHLECRATPGHTDGCVTFVSHDHGMAFTGDSLLIRGCGRTDFQQGNPKMLYNSVHWKILSLPEDFLLYPGHDYTGQSVSTVAEEKVHNRRLTKPLDEFVTIMENLNLPYPKQIERAVPLNMVCGLQEVLDAQKKDK